MTEQIKSFIHNLVLQQSLQVEECFPRLPPWTLGNVLMRERPISAYIAGLIVCQELTFQNQSDGIWPETFTTGAQGPILCCKGNRLTWGTMKRGTWVKPSGEWAPWKRCNMSAPSFALLNQSWFISSALWSCLVMGCMYKHRFPSRAWIVDRKGFTELHSFHFTHPPNPYPTWDLQFSGSLVPSTRHIGTHCLLTDWVTDWI